MRSVIQVLVLATVVGVPPLSTAKTWVVPSVPAPTIQMGIDHAAAGDTVLVKCGSYAVKHLTMKSGILLVSELADPDCAALDGLGLDVIMDCHYIDASTIIQGFTFEHGSPRAVYSSHSSLLFVDCLFDEGSAGKAEGGAIYSYYSALTFRGCEFTDNTAGYNGGAVYSFESDLILDGCTFRGNYAGLNGGGLRCVQSDVEITDGVFFLNWTEDGGGLYCRDCVLSVDGCLFRSNSATGRGGALLCYRTPALISRCTFARNAAQLGGSLYLWNSAGTIVENSILAFGPRGPAVSCLDPGSEPALSCCDVYGNIYGDWVGCIAGQLGIDGNIAGDPRFCAPLEYDYEIALDSPCAPGNSPPGCGLIGARDATCAPTSMPQASPRTTRGFHLAGNAPNPFNPSTVIEYTIPAKPVPSSVVLAVYDVWGREVIPLVDRVQGPGTYRVAWDGTDRDGTDVASGVYFCRLTWNRTSRTHRMVLLR